MTAAILPSSPPPAEDAAFDTALQAVVVAVTGLPSNMVRPRWQLVAPPQPEPEADWCAIGVVDETPEDNTYSRHDYTAAAGNGETTTQTNVTVQILASFYGVNAKGYAALMRDGLMIAQNREALTVQSVSLVAMPDPVLFVPTMLNERAYPRADVRFRLRRAMVRVWPIRNIKSIQGAIIPDEAASYPFTVSKD